MMSNQDPARQIAERVARRLAGDTRAAAAPTPGSNDDVTENRRARIVNFVSTRPPARTQSSIGVMREKIATTEAPLDLYSESAPASYPQVAQSPWLAPFTRSPNEPLALSNSQSAIRNSQLPDHPSQERFGVEEAAVSELVEFFENEKQCSVDPSGKPCDHCAMCSSRGF